MKLPYVFLLLALTVGLAGCGGSATTMTPPAASTPNVTGNWQIQSGGTGSTPTAGVLLLGDLVSSATGVTGTFRFSDLAIGNGCGALNQVITVTGTVDTSTPTVPVLRLTSSTFSGSTLTVQLLLPTALQGFGTGTIAVNGPTCTFASSPAISSLFPSATGTYTGTLAPGTGAPAGSATANLTLVQATSASADGQFATTGTLQFAAGGCSTSTPLTGTASGIGIMVNAPGNLPVANMLAFQPAPGLTQTLMTTVLLFNTACPTQVGAQYSGTLNKQ